MGEVLPQGNPPKSLRGQPRTPVRLLAHEKTQRWNIGWEKNTILQPSMTDCAEITCCMGQGCMNGNTRPGSIRRNGIAPRMAVREKVFSRFSSRYSSGNLRCTAYICTTVISWVSCPRNSNRVSTARNWSVSGKTPRESLQNTLLFTTTSFPLCRPSWTTARACPGR